MDKIFFKDLSKPLKTAIVIAWFIGGFWLLSFLVGVIIGMMEGLV